MKKVIRVLFVFVLLAVMTAKPVRADVAPPETVPGSNVNPESESTQVRMVAETVILTVSEDPANADHSTAETRAVFTMRNLGTEPETMDVRFPLSFFNGTSDGFGRFPEIEGIDVRVDGKRVATRNEVQPFLEGAFSFREREDIPWSIFEVTFPPDQDVVIEVVYTVQGFGYYPYDVFKYVLETGAGWNGTIGSAEIVLRLPYEASEQNVWVEDVIGYSPPTPGGVFSGNEVRWKFEELEPTFENNLEFVIVTPSLWQKVLTEDANITRNRNDGEAWGRLGKAYKEIIMMSHGNLRSDPVGQGMFELSRSAYETCLGILPEDPLWMYGYAELLWSHYYFDIYALGKPDTQNILPTLLMRLQTALSIDPNLQQAKDLLNEIYYAMPDAVSVEGDTYVYLGLTATPVPPTPWSAEATPTIPSTVVLPTSTFTMGVNTPEPTPVPSTNPLCGGAFLLPALFGLVILNKKRK